MSGAFEDPFTSERPEVYTRQGFGQSTGMGQRPGIVVVDFTWSFVDPSQFGGGNIPAAVIVIVAFAIVLQRRFVRRKP